MTQPVGAPQPSAAAFASWGARVGASIIDAIPNIVVFILMAVAFGTSDTSGGSASFQLSGAGAAIYYLFAIGWLIYNLLYLQGSTGQSIGKRVLGIAVYKAGTSEPLGAGLTFVRQIVHVVDAAPCLIGFLWPLWDSENRTFADMIMSSRSYKV